MCSLLSKLCINVSTKQLKRKILQNLPNCSNISLHFLKLSSIFGNFKIMLLSDFIAVPSPALRCIASTILASSFVSGIQASLEDSGFPTKPPIPIHTNKMGLQDMCLATCKTKIMRHYDQFYIQIPII